MVQPTLNYSQPIDVVENITRKDFQEKYFVPQKPVVLRGLFKQYPAYEKWTLDYFRKSLGNIQVGLHDAESDARQLAVSQKTPGVYMKFADYLDILERNEPYDRRIFLGNLFKYKPDLLNDFGYPDIASRYLRKFPYLFFGGKDSIVRIHQDIDMSNVFLTQFHGRKHVVLFSPEYSTLLYRFPMNVHSEVDITKPNYEKYPGLRYVKGMQCTLEQGDTLFMPSGYWHYITYTDGGFSLSVRAITNLAVATTGAINIATMHLDNLIRNVWGNQPWLNKKREIAHARAQKAIDKINRQKPLVLDMA